MSNIGEKIKELRIESGATQLQLGEYAGCSGQVISNIERGYTNPSAQVLNKIAEFFHVPSEFLQIIYWENQNLSGLRLIRKRGCLASDHVSLI